MSARLPTLPRESNAAISRFSVIGLFRRTTTSLSGRNARPPNEHHFMPINVLPKNFMRSQMVITMNAAPHRYLFRSCARCASLGTEIGPVLTPVESIKPGDASLAAKGVSFLVGRCAVGGLDTSPPRARDRSGFSSGFAAIDGGAAGKAS